MLITLADYRINLMTVTHICARERQVHFTSCVFITLPQLEFDMLVAHWDRIAQKVRVATPVGANHATDAGH